MVNYNNGVPAVSGFVILAQIKITDIYVNNPIFMRVCGRGKGPTDLNRFRVILDHSFDPRGVGWQQTRGMLALGSGGLFGQGLFKGIQTQSSDSFSLPARQTDFIFCVCGEELGMAGCLLIIILEFLLVYRCFQTARLAKSSMDALICIGFGTMLIFQALENIGMCQIGRAHV